MRIWLIVCVCIPLFLAPSFTSRHVTVSFATKLQDKVDKATQFSPPMTQFIKRRRKKKDTREDWVGTDTRTLPAAPKTWQLGTNAGQAEDCSSTVTRLPACTSPPQMMASDRHVISHWAVSHHCAGGTVPGRAGKLRSKTTHNRCRQVLYFSLAYALWTCTGSTWSSPDPRALLHCNCEKRLLTATHAQMLKR